LADGGDFTVAQKEVGSLIHCLRGVEDRAVFYEQ
jgi:hypothetical protein